MVRNRSAVLVLLTLVLVVGSSTIPFPTNRTGASASAAAIAPPIELYYAQVRAQYIDLSGNRDETNTICTIVNRSLTRTIYLGDVTALGLDGLEEVLAVHTGLNGVGIPPLGSVDLPVDSVHFPGLQPELEPGERGVENLLVSWSGPKEAVRVTAAIHLQLPGDIGSRVLSYVDGHPVSK